MPGPPLTDRNGFIALLADMKKSLELCVIHKGKEYIVQERDVVLFRFNV